MTTRAWRYFVCSGSTFALSAAAAHAQFSWSNGTSGNWSDNTRWSIPFSFPNNSSATVSINVVGTYVVSLNGTITSSTLTIGNADATLRIGSSSLLGLTSSTPLNLNGDITLNELGGTSASTLTLSGLNPQINGSGTGSISLNATGGDLHRAAIQVTGVATNNITIRGRGNLLGVWNNQGLFSADVNASTLQLATTAAHTNGGTIQAINGGTFQMSGGTLTQTTGPGQLIANGGTLNLTNTQIIGGSVQVTNGGAANLFGTITYNGVTHLGPLDIPNASTLIVPNATFNHSGTIRLNPWGGASASTLRFDAATIFGGIGETILNATAGDPNRAVIQANGFTVIHGPSRVLRGRGNILGSWANQGEFRADQPASTLQFGSVTTQTNQGLIRASNGGLFLISGHAVDQTTTGRLFADGGTIALNNATVIDGQIEVANGGTLSLAGANTFTNVDVTGAFDVPNGSTLNIAASAGFNHNQIIRVNPSGGTSPTSIQLGTTPSLGGTGEIMLNASGGVLTRAELIRGSPENFTIGPARTLAGTGRVFSGISTIVQQGTINPGTPAAAGRISIEGLMTLANSSVLNVDVASAAAFDLITFNQATALNGTLRVGFLPGGGLAAGQTIDVITAPSLSGAFDTVILPAGVAFQQLSNRIRLIGAPCTVDFNDDGFINQEDLSGYITSFLTEPAEPGPSGTNVAPCPGEPAPYDTLGYAADFNRDCSFNQEDLTGLITEYFGQAESPFGCVPG